MTLEQLEQITQDPKTFLSRAYRANEKIAARRERIESWRELALSITAVLKPVVSSGGGPSKKVETCVVNIIELEEEINEQIQELVNIQHEIYIAIHELVKDSNLQALLELRYLNCYRWEEIAVMLNYTFRWTMTLHGRALAALQKESALIHTDT